MVYFVNEKYIQGGTKRMGHEKKCHEYLKIIFLKVNAFIFTIENQRQRNKN